MSDYYDLEKTAEILKLTPAEVNRLREKGEIQGFRDGSNWKFKRDVIDNYYVTLTQKKKSAPFVPFDLTGEGEEEDLLSSEDELELPTMMADSASFAQFGEGFLSLSDGQTGGVNAASDANLDDGLLLVDDKKHDALALSDGASKPQEQKIEIFAIQGENDISGMNAGSGSGLNLGSDSGISIIGGSGSGIDLAGSDRIFDDDDVVIGGSSSGLNLGGDSGISLLDAAAESGFSLGAAAGGSDAILELAPEDDILALIDGDVDPDTATVLGAEDDFQLQADDDLFLTDDSESSSQVIAIEGDLANEISDFAFTDEFSEVSVAPAGDDDLLFASEADTGITFTEVAPDAENLFGGFDPTANQGGFADADDISGGFGAGTVDPAAATVPTAVTGSHPIPKFTGLSVTVLAVLILVMTVGGSLMFELVRCIWSWSEPFTINSSILGLFGK
ncbi:MAG: helix-turn-helix domain-containing protein [Planctomycetaceae bacterium]|nr:helix-turn-helix domain-containing protein [Planctomycetaceae bacterium]